MKIGLVVLQPRRDETRSPLHWRQLLLVYLLAAMVLAVGQFQYASLYDPDGFYHIRFAHLLRTQGFIRNFEWASMSIFKDHFSDKEFLFHVLLIPFTYFDDLIVGMKAATVVFGAGVIASFWLILRLNRIHYSGFWTAFLVLSSAWFLVRLSLPRPHVVSIAFVLWATHFVVNRRLWPLGILSTIYALTYTAFHLPIIIGLIVALARFIRRPEIDWRPTVVAGSGIVLGMLLNPYFPDNFRMFVVQNLQVMGLAADVSRSVPIAIEFRPLTDRDLVVGYRAALTIVSAALCSLFMLREQVEDKIWCFGALALGFFLLNLWSVRFSEYSVPFMVLFSAAVFSEFLPPADLKKRLRRRDLPALAPLFVGALMLAFVCLPTVRTYSKQLGLADQRQKIRDAALYIRDKVPSDKMIFTCDWDATPELFYYAYRHRYMVILDPTFMLAWNADLYAKWRSVLEDMRSADDVHRTLSRDFDVTHGICRKVRRNGRFFNVLNRSPKFQIVYADRDAFVFEVLPPDPTGTPPTPR